MFNEGSKILFRVSLALIKIHAQELIQTTDYQTLFVTMKRITKSTFDPEHLMRVRSPHTHTHHRTHARTHAHTHDRTRAHTHTRCAEWTDTRGGAGDV
jgi:ABC-type nickel/cobalt efflux system permease component RcnA